MEIRKKLCVHRSDLRVYLTTHSSGHPLTFRPFFVMVIMFSHYKARTKK